MTDEEPPIVERGPLAMSDAEWDQAVQQAAVIAPLAALDVVGQGAVNDAAALLGVSRRQVYVLIDRYRRGTGRVTDLIPGRSGGGRGSGRLTPPVEAVIDGLIRKRYLKRQKLSLAVVHRDIVRACTEEGLPAPSRSTVARRQPKLSKSQEAHLVSLYKGGAHTTTEIAELFKVARSTVYRIVQRTP